MRLFNLMFTAFYILSWYGFYMDAFILPTSARPNATG
jgi:hypothetical protein